MIDSVSLTDLARHGDAEALSSLLRRSEPDLRRFAAKVCRSSADADDAVSHAMSALVFKLEGFRGLSRLSTWLFSVVRNECLKYERVARRWVFGVEESVIDPVLNPEQAADRSQLLQQMVCALRELRPELREVFVLRELEQLAVDVCAARLGITEGAVKVRLHRARGELRRALTEAP